jgi:riboflavin kinase/FMN adenylyltransferase
MRRHSTFPVPQDARGTSAAIGNFDGVHLGHQAILKVAAAQAAPLSVLTFEPHPREVFAPDAPPFRLMTSDARAHRLEKLGVAELFEVAFDRDLASLSPEAFAEKVLVDDLGLSHVTIGRDFRFGRDRAGDAPTLQKLGADLGFGVKVADLVAEGDIEVSSTRIRDALSEGRPGEAARMLGHWHRIEGVVEHGEKRGRELGYPTANLSVDGLHLPRFGVYAVEIDVLTGAHEGSYGGVASLGVRPMFGENRPNFETFIFDFKGDLYGAEISVALVAFLRDEVKFEGVDKLIAQMDDDSARARAVLASL